MEITEDSAESSGLLENPTSILIPAVRDCVSDPCTILEVKFSEWKQFTFAVCRMFAVGDAWDFDVMEHDFLINLVDLVC